MSEAGEHGHTWWTTAWAGAPETKTSELTQTVSMSSVCTLYWRKGSGTFVIIIQHYPVILYFTPQWQTCSLKQQTETPERECVIDIVQGTV